MKIQVGYSGVHVYCYITILHHAKTQWPTQYISVASTP